MFCFFLDWLFWACFWATHRSSARVPSGTQFMSPLQPIKSLKLLLTSLTIRPRFGWIYKAICFNLVFCSLSTRGYKRWIWCIWKLHFCNARFHFFGKFNKTQYLNQIFQLTPEVNWPVSVCCRSFSVLSRPPQWLKAKSKTQPRLKVIYNRGGNKQSDSWGSDSCTKSLMSNFIHTLSTPSCLQPS